MGFPLIRYRGPFLQWTREELKEMDERKRKLMTMHKALHARDDVDWRDVSRKEGGRELTSIIDSVDASIQRFEDYTENHEGGLIQPPETRRPIEITRNTKTNRNNQKTKKEEKKLYGRYKWLINNILRKKTWTCLRKGILRIVQEISMWPSEQMEYVQPSICPGEWDTQTFMGLWHRNGSPNLSQTTKPYNNQQKQRTCKIVNFAVPADHRVNFKQCEKKDKYLDPARKSKKIVDIWKWHLY